MSRDTKRLTTDDDWGARLVSTIFPSETSDKSNNTRPSSGNQSDHKSPVTPSVPKQDSQQSAAQKLAIRRWLDAEPAPAQPWNPVELRANTAPAPEKGAETKGKGKGKK